MLDENMIRTYRHNKFRFTQIELKAEKTLNLQSTQVSVCYTCYIPFFPTYSAVRPKEQNGVP